MNVMTKTPDVRDLRHERPFEENGPWKQRRSNQTKPFLPNRLYVDEEAGVVSLVCMKSKNGNDYAVSADALEVLPAREADPDSWIREAYVMLADGDFEKPNEIVVSSVMTAKQAVDRVAGATAQDGRGSWGRYFWFQADEDDKPF